MISLPVRIVREDLTEEFADSAMRAERVACDIETTGLDWASDRIATCQIHVAGIGTEVVQLQDGKPERILTLITSSSLQKVFHHAAFDLRFMRWQWGFKAQNVACTKVLAKILGPDKPSDHYSLKYLMELHLGVRLDKSLQTSDWTTPFLSEEQSAYAVGDVSNLLPLIDCLTERALDLGLSSVMDASFDYLTTRVETDLRRCGDIFSY